MAAGGYVGRMLRVDMTSNKVTEEKLSEDLVKAFGGQIGIGVKVAYDEVPPNVKATDPQNRLIFITGPFTGTRVQAPSNFQVVSKNAITGCNIAVGTSHGFWGPRLKFAGYDGIIVQGTAEKPVYLWIHDGECEIRDASGIWGKTDTFEAEDVIKNELGLDKVSCITIGPAGERLCAAAIIENDHGHIAAKGNTGIVMGSKKLKAIAVSGTGKVAIADPDRFKQLAKKWHEENLVGFVASVDEAGTGATMSFNYNRGQVPIKNFTTGIFPEYKTLTGQYLREKFSLKRNPCYGCSLRHCHIVTVPEGPHKGFVGEEPEFEDLTNLGSLIGVSDPGAVTWLTNYVDRLGLDANWAGSIVSWAIEAYGRGILSRDALGGLELRWGDEKVAAKLLRMIAYREGIGDTLALGLKNGPEKIGGKEAAAFAVHFKGEANHAHDPRANWDMMLGLAIAGAGPRWEGFNESLEYSPEGKVEAVIKGQIEKLFGDTLGVCWFGYMNVSLETLVQAYQALTGWKLSVPEALSIGERIANVQRAFNVRHGFKPEMDLDISPRLLEAPPDGGAKGRTIAPYFNELVRGYNERMGWDWETGKPSRSKLELLGLFDVVKDLYG